MKKYLKWVGLVVIGALVVKKVTDDNEKRQREFFEAILTDVKEKVSQTLIADDKIIGTYIEMNDYMLSEYDMPVILGGITTMKNDYQFIVCSQTGELIDLIQMER